VRRGKKAFRHHYGKRAMQKCVRRAAVGAREDIEWAGEACTDDLVEFGSEQFAQFYGIVADGSDAWNNCVLEDLGLIDIDDDATFVDGGDPVDDGT
jgi:hypothetical protein